MLRHIIAYSFFLVLISALLFPGITHAGPDKDMKVLIISDRANLYPEPSTDSQPVETVTKGTRLMYLGETKSGDQTWYQVKTSKGRIAYLQAESGFKTKSGLAAVVTVETENSGGTDTTTITKTMVVIEVENKSVYTAADESSQVLGTVAKGLSFEVLEEVEGWYKIDFGANPGWVTREGTSKIIEKETKTVPRTSDTAKLIVTWQKPDDNAPGMYWGSDVGALVYGFYGSWKTWVDSDHPLVDDFTDELSIGTDPALAVSVFPGYKWNRFVFGAEFAFNFGRFDIEDFSSKPTYIVMRGGPRIRYFILHDKWRPFVDVMGGYSYTMIQSDSFDDSHIYMDHYTLGMGAGIVYHKVSNVDFALGWAKSWDYGLLIRSDFFGPIKTKQLSKSSEMEVRAAYGWMPLGIFFTMGSLF